jgi:hypothetical protein
VAEDSDNAGRERSGVEAWIGRHAVASLAVVFAAGALLGGLLIWAPWRDDDQPGRFEFSSTEVPGEYLYLDPERVVSYLAQIRGGFSDKETQTESESVSESASAEAAVSAGIERRREAGVSRVVTATTAADFLNLLDKLQDSRVQRPVRVGRVDARPPAATPEEAGRAFADEVMGLTEGDFVVIRNVRVLMPRHVRPYDTVRRLGVASFGADPATRRAIRRYLAAVGPDPTIVLNVGAHAVSDDGGHFPPVPGGDGETACPATAWRAFGMSWPEPDAVNARVLVPVRYGLLAPESSLFSGGDSIIVGKVIRVLREPPDPAVRPRESDVCFTDEKARRTFTLTTALIPEPGLGAAEMDRADVVDAAGSYAEALAPAAVVLPVAIYR